jgi:glycosyltransferase involved in cell wall biosynthesis
LYKGKSIGVVVPALNEEVLIVPTLMSMPSFIDRIYAVDDGSSDGTLARMREATERDPRITVIVHPVNKGVGASIVDGYRRCLVDGVDVAVVMAGDNQMDPQWITTLVDPIVDGKADYTKGNRLVNGDFVKGMSTWRLVGNATLSFLTKISSGYWQMVDPQNGYTAISKRALEAIELENVYPGYGYCNDILVKLNVHSFKMLDVPVPAKYGAEKSKIKYRSYIVRVSGLLLRNFFWRIKMKYLVLGFSPIFILYILGIILTPLGLFFGIISFFNRLIAGSLFVSEVISSIIFLTGTIFLLFAMLFDIQMSRSGNGKNI